MQKKTADSTGSGSTNCREHADQAPIEAEIQCPLASESRWRGTFARRCGQARGDVFREVVGMILEARGRALQAVNSEMVELNWQVGGFISGKIETAA